MNHFQDENLDYSKELQQYIGEFIAYFELAETKMSEWRLEIEQQSNHIQQQQETLKVLTEKSLTQIDNHSKQVIENINSQLNQYNPQQFQRIARENCEQVKRTINDAVNQNNKLLQKFQIRFNFFAVLTTILTAFIVVLYLNGEWPWEMHHQAKSERQAGKMLLQAWPKLSQEEKTKILGYISNS